MRNPIPANEYNPYYKGYIQRYDGLPITDNLKEQLPDQINFWNTIPIEKSEYRYAEGKWSPKEILLHLNDTERVMSYRALAIARGDKTPIPGFDQDVYVEHSKAHSRSLNDILTEYTVIRNASILLFESFANEQLSMIGTASESPVSVRALGYIILGHSDHHKQIIEERYLDQV